MHRIRVGVLMGGKSLEREVSFNSGRTVCDHLDTYSYDVIPLYQTQTGKLYVLPLRFLHRGKTTDFVHRLEQEAQNIMWDDLKTCVDIIYIAQHGKFAEDGTMQGFLEILSIPYVGSKVLASALGMDKIMQKKILSYGGISVPDGITILPHEMYAGISLDEIIRRLESAKISLPCVVKPYKEGSSFGVTIVQNYQEIPAAVQKAAYCNKGNAQAVIIEKKIDGMEFTSIIITDERGKLRPLSVTEVVPNARNYFDYEQKYMPGKSVQFTPARCTQEEKNV